MQLAFIIYSMQAGGAERVLSIMANYWSEKSQKVTVFTLDDSSQSPFYDLDSRIHQVPLDMAGVSKNSVVSIFNNLRRLYIIRRAIRAAQPDTIISFMTETNILTLIATFGLSIPVIVTEHTDPWTGPIADAWAKLRFWLYPRASRVVVLNERSREFFNSSPRIRVSVMPNPVVVDTKTVNVDAAPEVTSKYLIIAMGRLSRGKRFDLLIQAYSHLAKEFCEWDLMILGEGPERKSLEKLVNELELTDRVKLPGTVRSPHAMLTKADIFVSSSELEGFPMAICEALACGLPVIATEYHSAVRDIIQDGQNGILVPPGDTLQLATSLEDLIKRPQERKRLAVNAVEIDQRFSVEIVMQKWDCILNEVSNSQATA